MFCRQACAIESAARYHPKRDIFVVFSSPVGVKSNEKLPPYIDMLYKYDNIHFRNMDLWRYSMNSPIEEWSTSNQLFDSHFLYEHMSDILRILSLYRYGGIYLDLDVVVQMNFDDMGDDFIVDDWDAVIATSIINLNNYGIGQEVSRGYLK